MKTIHIFGDSTTQEYNDAEYPQQGWAHFLDEDFSDEIKIVNYGHGGYSLKFFLYSKDYINGKVKENEPEKSEWHDILSNVKSGDYMIMYWGGINDMLMSGLDCYRPSENGCYVRDIQCTSRESYIYVGEGLGTHDFFTLTSTVEESVSLFRGMINEVKAKGATPIIVRGTGKYYTVKGDDKNVISVVRRYSERMEDVAKSTGCIYINVGSEFERGFETIGYEKMLEKYFLSLKAYDYYKTQKEVTRFIPDFDDNVHYNVEGARHIGKIFVEQLKKSNSDLKNYLK